MKTGLCSVTHRGSAPVWRTVAWHAALGWLAVSALTVLWPVSVEGVYQPATSTSPPPGASYAAASSTLSPHEALDRLPYVPGRLIVKMKASVSACVDCLLQQGQALAPALGSSHLDDLNRLYGLRGARAMPLQGPNDYQHDALGPSDNRSAGDIWAGCSFYPSLYKVFRRV
jgi:hypothetical protein